MEVRRHCRRDGANGGVVRVVWHDLLKYTHMGRAIMAAMTAVSVRIAQTKIGEKQGPTVLDDVHKVTNGVDSESVFVTLS